MDTDIKIIRMNRLGIPQDRIAGPQVVEKHGWTRTWDSTGNAEFWEPMILKFKSVSGKHLKKPTQSDGRSIAWK